MKWRHLVVALPLFLGGCMTFGPPPSFLHKHHHAKPTPIVIAPPPVAPVAPPVVQEVPKPTPSFIERFREALDALAHRKIIGH